LDGQDDGTFRYVLGRLSVRDSGNQLAFTPSPPPAPSAPRWNVSGKVIDFGTLRTDGSVYLVREGNAWVLRPLNRSRAFTVEIDRRKIPVPQTVQAIGGSDERVKPVAGDYWKLPLNGASQYRWPAP
jgi:hypothetical protein